MISDSIIVRFLASGPRGQAVFGFLAVLGGSWGPLELKQRWNCEKRCRNSTHLRPSWGSPGGCWRRPGRLLAALGPSGRLLGGSWAAPGAPWGALGRLLVRPRWLSGRVQPKPEKTTTVQRFCWFLGLLGPPWVGPGRLLGRRESSLAPSWAVLGALRRLLRRPKWILGAC